MLQMMMKMSMEVFEAILGYSWTIPVNSKRKEVKKGHPKEGFINQYVKIPKRRRRTYSR